MRDLADPPMMRQIREQQKWMRDLADPPMMRQIREQKERVARMLESPVVAEVRRDQHTWGEGLGSDGFAALAEYQSTLVDGLVHPPPDRSSTARAADPWFGARSWDALLGEIERLLKILELITTGIVVSREAGDMPFPSVLIAVIFMLLVAGELALSVAKASLEQD
jgi:hypothetical protein